MTFPTPYSKTTLPSMSYQGSVTFDLTGASNQVLRDTETRIHQAKLLVEQHLRARGGEGSFQLPNRSQFDIKSVETRVLTRLPEFSARQNRIAHQDVSSEDFDRRVQDTRSFWTSRKRAIMALVKVNPTTCSVASSDPNCRTLTVTHYFEAIVADKTTQWRF